MLTISRFDNENITMPFSLDELKDKEVPIMSNNVNYSNMPRFTGRHVPIEEISKATGKSCTFLREGLKQGFLKFGYACKRPDQQNYSFYCPDKLVWEELGYFNENPKERFEVWINLQNKEHDKKSGWAVEKEKKFKEWI